ncbi:MAG: TIGR00730 family Rossman fold protein [Flavobacteriales bacterium]|nr:MAG: TIGR00730 family Rossman fold protein [Flavobacteriales bacterium]
MVNKNRRKVCIFCGSKKTNSEELKGKIYELVNLFAKNNMDLVYGGSKRGIMGLVNDTFRKEQRKVIGVLPFKAPKNEEKATNLNETIYTNDLFERKRKMIELSDFFLILPGGIGTLDETFEIITSNSMNFSHKKVAIFNCFGFYDNLINQLNKMIDYNFVSDDIWNKIIIESNPHQLFEKLVK